MKGAARILVVEDDPGIALLERRSLERAGYAVCTATTAEEAFERVERNELDLIVLDYHLPEGRTGLDVHAHLKSSGRDLPVIMVTGQGDEATIIEALRAGVQDFVTKSAEYLNYLPEAVGRVLTQVGTERLLEESEQRYKSLFEHNPDAVYSLDLEGNFLTINAAAEQIIGYGVAECLDEHFGSLVVPEDRERALGCFHRAAGGEPQNYEIAIDGKDGRRIELGVTNAPIVVDSKIVGVYGIAKDITERKELERKLVHQAFHDPLTGLPNRALFLERLGRALAPEETRENSVAVLFLDLDDFKIVNDSLNHEVGDRLLVAVGERLKGCLKNTDTAARLGGDEFTVLLENIAGVDAATKVAARLAEGLRAPFEVEGRVIFITTSVGIALNGYAGYEPGDLLRDADVAMYRAKLKNRARYEVFDPERDAYALDRLTLENDLRLAVERGQLVVHYQPVFSLETNRIAGMEALLRWNHPERGLMSPARFIPLAEETGLIVPIGRWVLENVCCQARDWQERYPDDPPLVVGVNLSLRQFQEPGLVEDIARALRETGLDPYNLALEITESVAMHDVDSTVATLEKLKALGVWLVIDDFGTGNSSPTYLTRRFKMDHLKIDGSFIREFVESPEDSAIISGLIGFAQALGLRVTAEGVETAGQLQSLREMGCDYVQGYHVAKPLPAEAAFEFVLAPGYP